MTALLVAAIIACTAVAALDIGLLAIAIADRDEDMRLVTAVHLVPLLFAIVVMGARL